MALLLVAAGGGLWFFADSPLGGFFKNEVEPTLEEVSENLKRLPLVVNDNSDELEIGANATLDGYLKFQPSEGGSVQPGQLYVNQQGQLIFFDGDKSYVLSQKPTTVNGVGGNFTIGRGLDLVRRVLINTGVLNVRGSRGISVSGSSDLTLKLGDQVSRLGQTVENNELDHSTVNYLAGSGLDGGGEISLGQTTKLNVDPGNGLRVVSDQVALGSFTADWIQSSAFDVILNNRDSQLQMLEDDANPTEFGTFDVSALAQDTTYDFPDPSAASDEVCLVALGNCAGAGTGVTSTGGGTADRIAKFTSSQNIENSSLVDDGSVVSIDTGVNLDVDSGNLYVDATNNRVGIGTATPGTKLDVAGGTIQGDSGLNITAGTVTVPGGEIDNAELANSSLTVTAGTGLSGGGSVSLGGSTTLSAVLGSSIDTTEIVDGTIQEADLDADAPTDGFILSYNSATGGFSWVADSDTQLTEGEVEAFIFDVDNTGTLSSGTLALDSLSYTGTIDDGNVNDALTISSSGSVADGALSANVSLLGQNIEDGEVDDSITIGSTGSVADGALSSNVSLLGQSIESSEITDGTIQGVDVESTNVASDNLILSYDSTSGGFTWVTDDTGTDTRTAVSDNGTLVVSDTSDINFSSDIDVTDDTDGTVTVNLGSNVSLLGQSIQDGEVDDNLTISSTGSVADGALSSNVSLLGQTIDNTELVNNSVSLSYGAGLSGDASVALGGTLNINSDLGSTIETGEITDDTILEADLDSTNTPTDNYNLTYDSTSGGFTWVDSSTQDGSGVDSLNALTGALTLAGTANQISVTDDGSSTITLSTPQNIDTTASPTFATLDTGQGANELYDMDQNVQTTSAVTFATLDTGQGANELYDMDQNVLTTSSVTFNALTLNGALTANASVTLGDGASDNVTLNGTIQGASPLVFEGLTADLNETTFAITDPTADRTITFPDLGGEVSLLAQAIENSELVNSNVTYTAGTGLTGGGAVALGNSATFDVDASYFDSNYFAQGGNSFGTVATVGTNDTQDLVFETNGTERARIDSTGNVGVGTSSPNAKLEVAGATNYRYEHTGGITTNTTVSRANQIVGVDTSGGAVTITLASSMLDKGAWIAINDEGGSAGSNSITVDTEGTETIDGNSSQTVSNNNQAVVLYNDGTNWFTRSEFSGGLVDYAEYFGTKDETLEAGEIVVPDPSYTPEETGQADNKAFVKKATRKYQKGLMGIISTSPHEAIGRNLLDHEDNPRPVALNGRVPVKVTDENGPIEVGDYITSSSVEGVGMKATDVGPVVGRALEAHASGEGAILVFIDNTYYSPDQEVEQPSKIDLNRYLQNGDSAKLANLNVSGATTLSSLTVTDRATFEQGILVNDKLVVNGHSTFNGMFTVNGHVISGNSSGSTTVVAGAAACSSPTVSVDGNDTAGTITVTTGTDCSGGGVLATVAFANAYGAAPRVVLTPKSSEAVGLDYFNGSVSSTDFTLDVANTPADSTTYEYNYHVIQ